MASSFNPADSNLHLRFRKPAGPVFSAKAVDESFLRPMSARANIPYVTVQPHPDKLASVNTTASGSGCVMSL
ncbi:hypothetical protein PoB_002578700 [Plakobranchus ocellatus]|uniref:Uncharacterized protein n=1 Tax=Plakobranchus ocellatus TaxID=259542 RepID=A0AAV3ZX70_9GAST|nr:hypothetical protein PoB_002578700 [Plakobranchus ocellatus]